MKKSYNHSVISVILLESYWIVVYHSGMHGMHGHLRSTSTPLSEAAPSWPCQGHGFVTSHAPFQLTEVLQRFNNPMQQQL